MTLASPPRDAARALLDKDYGRPDRMDGAELAQRVGDYYRRPDAGDVSGAVTAEPEARRNAVSPAPDSLEAFRSALVRKDPGDAALKPPASWTQAEVREVMRTYAGLPDRDPRKTQLANRTAEWFGRDEGFAGLAEVTRAGLGGLHPDPETGLQKTLNALGSRAGSWEPLKEDGWIGPKTTEGFSRVGSATPADDLVRSWAANLWEDWA